MADQLSIRSLKGTIKRVEEIGAYGGDAVGGFSPDTIEVHLFAVSSLTKTGDMYPAVRYEVAFAAGVKTYTEKEACWLVQMNGLPFITGVKYKGKLVGTHSDGDNIYATSDFTPPGASIALNQGYNVSTSPATAFVIFDTVYYDTGNHFSFSSPTILTIEIPGRYAVTGNITMYGNATGVRRVANLWANGGELISRHTTGVMAAGVRIYCLPVCGHFEFNAGDTVSMSWRRDDSETMDIIGFKFADGSPTNEEAVTNLSMSWIGPKSTTAIPSTVVETFTTPGTGTWTVPAGCTSVTVETWGGGAGGETTTAGGGGGGGGEYRILNNYVVIPGNVHNYRVGAGGTAAANGVVSTFSNSSDSAFVCRSLGGSKGSTTTGGAGGTGGIGDTGYAGGAGGGGQLVFNSGGGGGSSAGTGAIGGNGGAAGAGAGGTGGTAPTGGGNGGAGGFSTNGTVGSAPGGGGGGSGAAGNAGGAGGNGKVRLTYVTA